MAAGLGVFVVQILDPSYSLGGRKKICNLHGGEIEWLYKKTHS